MSAVPLRNNKAAASGVRAVTVLGATGSIGDSTMDLLRASRDRYRVEALTANTNVPALAKLAKEFGARFAAVADPARFTELKDALAGTRIECGAGESAEESTRATASTAWSKSPRTVAYAVRIRFPSAMFRRSESCSI